MQIWRSTWRLSLARAPQCHEDLVDAANVSLSTFVLVTESIALSQDRVLILRPSGWVKTPSAVDVESSHSAVGRPILKTLGVHMSSRRSWGTT